jgi:hypothetical protein
VDIECGQWKTSNLAVLTQCRKIAALANLEQFWGRETKPLRATCQYAPIAAVHAAACASAESVGLATFNCNLPHFRRFIFDFAIYQIISIFTDATAE